MKYKKLLFVIIIIIGVMFSLMLATSYAWYSFSAGSTTFNAVTSDKDVDVRFIKGEYINNTLAVPISNNEIDQYSDKHQFIVRTKNNKENNQILLKISLVDIEIDTNLRDKSLYVELYYQGEKVSTVTGDQLSISGAKTKLLKTVELEDDVDNNFEVRVYLLDNGENQSGLMGLHFSAKIQTEVVSRLKTNISDYSDADIIISSIKIDGASSDSLPVDGYYTMSSTCSKGSALSWNKYSKTITYSKGSKVGDSCSLVFTKDTSTKLLNTVEVGSYVKYMGNNGCDGNHCTGDNANYVSDDDMGYCYSYDEFIVNGWRIAYIKDNSAYLVSAGAPEYVATYVENVSNGTSNQTFSIYYYGSGYLFDETTGEYSLTGVTSSALDWSSNYNGIIANTPYTCRSGSSTDSCTTMYKVIAHSSSTQGTVITYDSYDGAGVPNHIAHLNKAALKYCNTNYAYNGVCDSTSSWSINDSDYQMITANIGTKKTLSNCNNIFGSRACGFNNDLIDNGSYYWFATPYSASSTYAFAWNPIFRLVGNIYSDHAYGVRPVLRLRSSVSVMSGSGTYKDPYVIQ